MLMQAGLGFTPAESGMITFVGSLGGMMARPVAASVFRVLGYRATMVWGTVLAGGFVALCATFRAEWPIAAFCVVLLTAGVLRSIQTTAFSTLAFAEVPSDRYRPANSLFVACQPLATVFGMAAGVAFLDLVAATAGREVPEPADFGWTFLVLGGVILLGAPVAMRLPRTAGDTLVHRTAVEG
jgi:MFS family permease